MTELKLRSITYDLSESDAVPAPDQFLVTQTAKGEVSTVYHIATVRQVKTKDGARRFALGVYTANDLKPHTRITDDGITVKGEPALPLVWYPRGQGPPQLHPDQVGYADVFGDFLARKTAGVVVLLALRQGVTYSYAQWADLDGIQYALGIVREVDEEQFLASWMVVQAFPQREPTGFGTYTLPANATDSQLLARYMAQVDAEAALLLYYAPGWQYTAWAQWQRSAKDWVDDMSQRGQHAVQALWYNHQVPAYGLSPATYESIIHAVSTEQYQALTRVEPPLSAADLAIYAQHHGQ